MYDSKLIKKTHYKRGKKIFPHPHLESLKEKESKFVKETSALTQSPSDGKCTSTTSVESEGLAVVCCVLISSCTQRENTLSQYQTSSQ